MGRSKHQDTQPKSLGNTPISRYSSMKDVNARCPNHLRVDITYFGGINRQLGKDRQLQEISTTVFVLSKMLRKTEKTL